MDAGFCSKQQPARPVTAPTCLSALFFNFKYDHIRQLCDFNIFPKEVSPQIIKASDSSFWLINVKEAISIICPEEVHNIDISPSVVVHLPCACRLSTATFDSPPAITACQQNTTVKVQHALNYAILAHFGMKQHLSEIPSKTFSETIPRIEIPNLPDLIRKVTGSNATSKLQNIEELAKVIDKDSIETYSSFNDGLWSNVNDLTSMFPSLLYLCLAWLTVISFSVIIIFLKVRSLYMLLLVQIPSSRALYITPSAPKGMTTQLPLISENAEAIFNMIFSLTIIIALLIMILYVIVKMCAMFHRCRRTAHMHCQSCFSAPECTDALHFYLRVDHLVLYLCSIPYELHQTTVLKTPRNLSVHVSYGLWPSIMLTWRGALQYSINDQIREVTFPKQIAVSFSFARDMRKAADSHNATLICKSPHHPAYTSVYPSGDGTYDPSHDMPLKDQTISSTRKSMRKPKCSNQKTPAPESVCDTNIEPTAPFTPFIYPQI